MNNDTTAVRPDLGPGAPVVSARGVCKHFPGVIANDDVNFDLASGEVHTLLGENGAGKSTLAAILCGLYRPDRGELRVRDLPVAFASPRDGLAHGIGMVHQHFRLVERFTVAENVVLGDPRLARVLATRAIEDEVATVAERFGLPIDPRARIADLAVGQRQRVEIVKALYRGADVLLLDEPTAVLTPQEVDTLFATVRTMTASGKSVVFISHKLGEVMEISDRVTVMRAGRVTGEVSPRDVDRHELARLMVGRDVDLEARVRVQAVSPVPADAPPVLVADHLSLRSADQLLLDDVHLEVRGGEILGVAGVSGNGQRELAEVIAGMRRADGRIVIDGRDVTGKGPKAARRAGLAFVPEERLGTGLAPSMSIAENLLLTRPRRIFVNRRKAETEARRIIEEFEIKAPGPRAATRVLSGGNAQKVLIARELGGAQSGSPEQGDRGDQAAPADAPRVLVAAAPTRGLDVGAIESVRGLINGFRAQGSAVVLISEDLEEVFALADRIVVLYRGRVAYETPIEAASREAVGRAMAGVEV